jgi:hypothetical protein
MSLSAISYVALEQLDLTIQDSEALEAYTFIHRILDTFGRILSNIKTNLVHFNKKFKRSELKFLHDSKHFAIDNLYRSKHFNKSLMVPMPSGMKVSYLHAVDALEDLLKKLDIEGTADRLIHYFQNESLSEPNAVAREISKLTKVELQKGVTSLFSNEKTHDVPLVSVIGTFEEIHEIDQKILKFEETFHKVGSICAKLDQIETEIDQRVTALENNRTHADRSYITALHDLVRTAAFQFDAFGVLIHHEQTIEHNFVLVMQKLIAEAAPH